jgi:hypothetical protein
MKWKHACVGLICLAELTAQGATILWPAAGLGGPYTSLDYDYQIGTETVFGDGAGVAMDLTPNNAVSATLQAVNGTAGAWHIWFAVPFGAPVDAATMASSVPFLDSSTWEANSLSIWVNQVFYLGFWVEGVLDYSDTYGWASLVWNGTSLTLLDSAMETTGVGLYAGTYTPVPEPATAGLAWIGLAACVLRRTRRFPSSSLPPRV